MADDTPTDPQEHDSDRAEMDSRSRGAQQSYVGQHANLRPGDVERGDSEVEDPDELAAAQDRAEDERDADEGERLASED